MGKVLFLIILSLTLFSTEIFSQQFGWVELPNAPRADTIGRFEDLYFSNANTGYAISIYGEVYRTSNGGATWTSPADLNRQNRSVGFFNPQSGIIGTLDSNNVLYRTTNGGNNWTDITSSIQGIKPKGICGISVVDENTAYGVGRYHCPSNIIKTTNGGVNWISIPIDTSLMRSAVDCKFWSADSGFVVGGYSPTNIYYNGNSVVLFTSNGGQTFVKKIYLPCFPES